MSNEKMREEFEAWFKARFWHECYEDVKHHLFAAWQASRESLVIELPSGGYFAGYDNEHMMESRDVREAIEAAGLKVKP